MVDRANLIKHLEPRVRPTGSQAAAISTALDRALAELLLALPFPAVQHLPSTVRAELVELLGLIDQKTCEKLAAVWEPKRKLDTELKGRVKKDILDLIEAKRPVYEPVSVPLPEARNGDRVSIKAILRSSAPIKDLKALTKKWDKDWKPIPESRVAYEKRLIELIDGAEPVRPPPRPQRGRRARR